MRLSIVLAASGRTAARRSFIFLRDSVTKERIREHARDAPARPRVYFSDHVRFGGVGEYSG